MSDAHVLHTAAIIQMGQTLPKVQQLLDDSGAELPSYGTLAPGIPALRVYGTLKDAVERVGYDPTAQNDPVYAAVMYSAALAEIAVGQQETIEELRERLAKLEERSGVKA